jgi:hypothetical protein
MYYKCITIQLSAIDLTDERFCHRFKVEPCDCRAGCALPPVVVKKNDYVIVSGFRRIKAMSGQSKDASAQVLIPQGDLDDKQLFLLSVALNDGAALSDLDRAVMVGKAIRRFAFSQAEAVEHLAQLCGVNPSWKMIKRYLDVGELEPVLQEYMFKHQVGLKFGLALLGLSADERAYVVQEVLGQASFTESEMEQFVGFAQALMKIRKTSLSGLFSERVVAAIFEMRQVPAKEKTRLLMSVLWNMRNPVQAGLFEKTRAIEKELSRMKAIAFSVPDSYEREHYCVTLSFRSRSELECTLADLHKRLAVFDGIEHVNQID